MAPLDPDGSGTPAPPRRSNGLSIFNAASLQSYTADKLSAPLTDFSVTGTDLNPFSSPWAVAMEMDVRNDGPFTITALPAILVVNSLESWDGVNNPRAAGGVTKSGTGTDLDPWTYTMPKGMKITSTGKINCWTPDPGGNQGQPIKFVIEGGDLQMDAGAVLNIERYKVRTGRFGFTLDLSVTNSITGAGQIGPITDRDSCPRDLTIQNVKNVSLASIDVHTENVNTGASDSRDMNITASGAVVVTGKIDNSDQDSGGDGGWGVTIKANTIDVNNIDTRGMRNDPAGRPPYSGTVVLQALSPIGNYDPNDGVNNASTNKLTVRGSIRTYGVDTRTVLGDVTLQSVVLQLVYGVIEIPPNGQTKTLQVGVVQNGASASDLFVDVSSSGQTVTNVVQWGGTWTPPAGSAPAFTTDPVIGANATAQAAYSGTLAGTATDADLDPLSYGKFSGPAWLQVAANGALSGTPSLTDSCTNTWQIWVTDGARFDVATLQIFVAAPPRWNDGDANFAYANAVQSTPYADTLATNVIYCGAQTLTFAKVSGPAWLSVASDGTLSGTPDPTNVMNNAFGVTVSDGTGTSQATLNIFVNGSPRFPINPFARATAFVSQGDYAVRSQTLAGAAIDPQDPANPNTLTWSKVSGPAWLNVAPDGALSGTPTAGDIGVNMFTVAAANAYPATTATLRIIVVASPGSAPVEVVTREYWDGLANPHASDGVTLTGTGSESDPATYTVPRGLLIYSSGQIYTSQPTGENSETAALHIKFVIQGDLTMDANNNAFVMGVHNRNDPYAKRNLILDLNGTNSIVGAGRILGLGNRVDAATFPDCFDADTPRILTITNVNNISLTDINVQVRNANNWGRPLLIKANGKVQVANSIDNSDRDTGGDGSNHITVQAGEIAVNGVDTRSFRTANFRNVGNIRLNALAAPAYATGGNNSISENKISIIATLRPTTPQANTTWGTITLESVILNLGTNAILNSPAPGKTTVSVGKIQGGVSPSVLFNNLATDAFTAAIVPNYMVNWFVPSL